MEVIQTAIKDVLILEPRVFKDARGYFFESFSQRDFDEKVAPILGHKVNFVQDAVTLMKIMKEKLDLERHYSKW